MKFLLRLLCLVALLVSVGHSAEEEKSPQKLRVLVVTGGHGFEAEPFFKIFQENPEITFTAVKHRKDADAFEREDLLSHDVVVLYDMPKTITEAQKARFLALFEKGVGVLVLHHALVSYQQWDDYERIIGGRYPEAPGKGGVVTPEVGYEHDVEIPVTIVAKDHPITQGLADFTIHDEIYWGYRVQPDVTPLLRTTHAKNDKPLAWVRSEGASRVAYLQLGHGRSAYENPQYRQLVAAGIRWVGRR